MFQGRTRFQKFLALMLAGVFCISATGCFGSFALTHKVYDFNKDVDENKWMQELVFLAFIILPVYGLASWGDAIIFNTIEFWTGDNPLDEGMMDTSKTVQTPEGEATMTLQDDGTVAVSVKKSCGGCENFTLERTCDGVVAKNAEGCVIKKVATDAQGQVVEAQ